MSQLAKVRASCLMTSADPAVVPALLSGSKPGYFFKREEVQRQADDWCMLWQMTCHILLPPN
ncbi:hypothetical protein SporoP33_12275 [Sporosarcina sp. P33]|nr:hypothetical protein SporoP33_12275 [Sporosarcina sp. P33]